MKILKHIFLLTIGLIGFTILLCCSNAKQEANTDLSEKQSTRISNSNTNQFNVAEFERNRELWTSRSIQNYKMIVGASGFLMNYPEEVLIEVKNHQAKSIKSLSKEGRNGVETYKNYNTIEKIFDFIERERAKKPARLNVWFNKEFGYPTNVGLDERFDMSDDKFSLEVKSLEIEK